MAALSSERVVALRRMDSARRDRSPVHAGVCTSACIVLAHWNVLLPDTSRLRLFSVVSVCLLVLERSL